MLRPHAPQMVVLQVFLAVFVASAAARDLKRKIVIGNQSPSKISVSWQHPQTGERILMTNPDVMPGADFNLDSFVGHSFVVRELPGPDGLCRRAPHDTCREAFFAVSANDDQSVRITPDIEVIFVDNQLKARQQANNLVEDCQAAARKTLAAAASQEDADAMERAMQALVGCVESGVATRLQEVNEEIAFQASVRTSIASKLENYTCVDAGLDSSEDVSTHTWQHRDRDSRTTITRTVHVKHERPASRIHVIENFISPTECQAMEDAARPKLHKATVADGRGGSRLSDNRKAWQAGIHVPWEREAEGDAIARLSRRVYDYTNHVLGLDIQEHGQEDLMSIQYFGRGRDDQEPDRYTPHCDGECTGMPHKHGQRMATMVMYCTVADDGGHTNFRNSGVHVKPESGSYIDPETKVMDTGFTEHSGCPVFEGEKKIVTQWIRYGVSKEEPWDAFNTLGIRYRDIEELELSSAEKDQESHDEL